MREELAKLMREIWAGWMQYLFKQCDFRGWGDEFAIIPESFVKRWRRQIVTSYDELSEKEKDSDRREADKVLELFAKHLLIANTVIERNPTQSKPERIAEARHAMVGWNKYYKVSAGVIECWLDYIEDGKWSAGEDEGDE